MLYLKYIKIIYRFVKDAFDMRNHSTIQIKKRKRFLPWMWFALALGYTLSPIDLVPDTLPVLGWLDDISILIASVLNLFQNYHENTHKQLTLILKYLKWLFLLFFILLVLFLGLLSYFVFIN